MANEISTLNDDTSDIGVGSSSTDTVQGNSDNIVSTLDDSEDTSSTFAPAPSSEGEAKTEEPAADKIVGGKEEEPAAAPDAAVALEKPRPYHEDPAWQRIIKERDEVKSELSKLQGQIDLLTKMTTAEKKEAATLPYVDITAMEDEELRDWQQNDPKGYAANLYAQITYEQEQDRAQKAAAQAQQQATQAQQDRFRQEVDSYSKQHEDFMAKWNSGEIPKFMVDHPGLYNAITAHRAMTEDGKIAALEAKFKADLEVAIKAKEEEILKSQKSKSQIRVLGEGPSSSSAEDPNQELNNIRKGNEINTLVERLNRLRSASG